MDEYNWDDFDAATQEYLNSYYPDLVSPNYTLSDADYLSLTSPISNQELSDFYGGDISGLYSPSYDFLGSLPSFAQQLDLGAAYQPTLTTFASPENFEQSIAQLTGDSYLARRLADEYASEQKAEEDLLNRGSTLSQFVDAPLPINYARGSMAEKLGYIGGELLPASSQLDAYGGVIGIDENPLDYMSMRIADPTGQGGESEQTFIVNKATGQTVGYLDDTGNPQYYASYTREEPSWLGGLIKAATSSPTAQAVAKAAQGTTITRNPDGSITIGGAGGGQQQRQPSAAESVAKMAGLLYQLTKKDKTPVKARESTVQNIGPQYQAARPVRTLYAKGGKVELPESVGGGLLPIAMKIAEMLISQNGGEEEGMPQRKGLIGGEESGQEDNVEAMLSPGEYVIDAEIVSALGDGNTDAGAKKLDEMRYNIRKHKRNGGLAQIAPKAKSPEKYMKG